MYACPEHGPNPILSGVPGVWGTGLPVACVGSQTACGAIITSGSPDTFVDGPIISDIGSFSANESLIQKNGVTFIKNPAPIQYTKDELAKKVDILANKKLQQEMLYAWEDSFGEDKNGNNIVREQGGWIIENPDGSISLQRIEGGRPVLVQNIQDGSEDSLGMSFPQPVPENAIGMFHTHPIHANVNLPSFEDIKLSDKHGIPGIIMRERVSANKKVLKDIGFYDNTNGDI